MEIRTSNPPRLMLWLMRITIKSCDRDFAIGDFTEMYQEMTIELGTRKALKRLWIEVLMSLPGFIGNMIYWRVTMINNYIKTATRNIKRHKAYSFINITGFALGLACCLLILLWIDYIISFDSFHEQGEQIHQVLVHGSILNNPSTPYPLAPLLVDSYPDILYATRYNGTREALVKYGKHEYYEDGIIAVDASFFSIFSFPLVRGDPASVLTDFNSIVISEDIAVRYFPGEDPMGKILTMNYNRNFTVTGIMENIPPNSSLRFDMLIPFERKIAIDTESGISGGWGYFSPNIFIRLQAGRTADQINAKIRDCIKEPSGDDNLTLSVLPFTQRLFFFTNFRSYIYIFSIIAAFVLIIACVNFMNLSTARAAGRAKEIGIRKVLGAFRTNIIAQFIGESVFLSLIAGCIAVLIVLLVLPFFSRLTGVTISSGDLLQPRIIMIIFALVILTGITSGSYPALFLSSFRPVRVLKGILKSGTKGRKFRITMVVFQFCLSSLLITGTAVVYHQLGFIRSSDVGYQRGNVINIPLRGDGSDKYEPLKAELARDPRIINISGSIAGMPYFSWSTGTAEWEGKETGLEVIAFFNSVDYDFIETFRIEMAEGRSFSRDFPNDESEGFIINEAFAGMIGLDPVVGSSFDLWGNSGRIIGVVKDFHFQPLNTQIKPLILLLRPREVREMSIRIQPGEVASTIDFIRETWERVVPQYPFEYHFLDDLFDERYRQIEKAGNLVGAFSLLAILISCLGLFGLASFTAERRSKEIGIRKVLGASVSRVTIMMLKESVICVLVANVIAGPLAWLMMREWLQNFAYKVELGPALMVLSITLTLLIALITVGFQAVQAARANPIDSLKYE